MLFFIQYLLDTWTFKFYFSIKHYYKLNLSLTSIEVTFTLLSGLNSSVCFQSIFRKWYYFKLHTSAVIL